MIGVRGPLVTGLLALAGLVGCGHGATRPARPAPRSPAPVETAFVYESALDGYRCRFDQEPEELASVVDNARLTIAREISNGAERACVRFRVTANDRPEDSTFLASFDTVLQRVDSTRSTSRGAMRGRVAAGSDKAGRRRLQQVFAIGDSAYLSFYAAPEAQFDERAAQRFLDSFDLVSGWRTVADVEGRFSVSVPAVALEHVEAATENAVRTLIYYVGTERDLSFTVVAGENRNLAPSPEAERALLDATVSELPKMGRVLWQAAATFDGARGVDALLHGATGFQRVRVLVIGLRVYLLSISAKTQDVVVASDAQRFFDSFQWQTY